MAEITPLPSEQQHLLHWQGGLQADIDAYFAAAHERVESVYQQHFGRLGAVAKRHWRCRRDVPADLLALPRSLWRLLQKLRGGTFAPRALTAKEQWVAQCLADEALDLAELETMLLRHLQRHPDYREGDVAGLRAELGGHSSDQAARRLHQAVARWGLSHDSSRDMVLFLGLGMLGRGLGDKVAFGSASILGVSLASSLYLGQQGWLGSVWASWFGVPFWVKAGGVAMGFAAMWFVTPVLAPFCEWGFNRVWSRRRIHRIVDEVHRELSPSLQEQFWAYGSYLQFVPDVLVLLRQLR